MDKIFIINYGYKDDWIMGKIAADIQREASLMGIECRRGELDEYKGEDICYHLSWYLAVPIPQAKHNSVFYTHVNNEFNEFNLTTLNGQFDSIICMSPEDVQYLIELGFDKERVFGRVLPVRNTYIKPITIGIFSACYPDGRKNEQWLIDYCVNNEFAQYVNFMFVGQGWGRVVEALEKCGCSSEWHNVSRKLPYEYQFQQNKLASLNYYIYMGMDGGAMGTYDAYAQDVPLCVTFDGFHKGIPDIDYSFDNRDTFFHQLDIIVRKHADRIKFFQSNTPAAYVKWLFSVWEGEEEQVLNDDDKKCISYNSVLEKKRLQYYPVTRKWTIMIIKWLYFKLKKSKAFREKELS